MKDFSDQTKIFNEATWSWPVHLIGAGGINNCVGPLLCKMGIKEIHIWDDDVLETRNLPTEVAYSYNALGNPKVSAMAETIYFLDSKQGIFQHQERVTQDTILTGIIICGVDSMKSRQEIWQAVKASFLDIPLFIDGRSSGEETAIFAFSPSDFESVEKYEDGWLYDDEEAMAEECGARNIGYISMYMAAEFGNIITRFHRDLPIEFYTPRNFAIK